MFGVSLCVGQGGPPCPRPASWLPLIPASILVPGLYQMMDFEKAESEEMAAPPVQLRGGREGGREDKGTAPAGLCVNSTTEERGRGDSSRVIGGWRWEGQAYHNVRSGPASRCGSSLLDQGGPREKAARPAGREAAREAAREGGREGGHADWGSGACSSSQLVPRPLGLMLASSSESPMT